MTTNPSDEHRGPNDGSTVVPVTPAPWTMEASFGWPATLAFYENRVALFRELERQDLLRRFRFESNYAEAVVSGSDLMILSPNGVTVSTISPSASLEGLRAVWKAAAESLELTRVIVSRVSLQFFVPLDLTYDEARLAVRRRALSVSFGDSVTDFAVLADGHLEVGGVPTSYQVEYGVVEETECAKRVLRKAGRLDGGDEREPAEWSSRVEALEFPPVSLFSDWVWFPTPAAASPDHAVTVVSRMAELSGSYLNELQLTI